MAKASLLWSERRRFVRCKKDESYVKKPYKAYLRATRDKHLVLKVI